MITVFGGLDAANFGGEQINFLIGSAFFVFRLVAVVYGYSVLGKEARDLNVHAISPVFWGAHVGSAQYVTNERLSVLVDLRYIVGSWGTFDTLVYFMAFLFMQSDRWLPVMAFEAMLIFYYVFLTFTMRTRKYPVLPLEDAPSEVGRPIHNENVLRRASQMINSRNNTSGSNNNNNNNNNEDNYDVDIIHGIN